MNERDWTRERINERDWTRDPMNERDWTRDPMNERDWLGDPAEGFCARDEAPEAGGPDGHLFTPHFFFFKAP